MQPMQAPIQQQPMAAPIMQTAAPTTTTEEGGVPNKNMSVGSTEFVPKGRINTVSQE